MQKNKDKEMGFIMFSYHNTRPRRTSNMQSDDNINNQSESSKTLPLIPDKETEV